MQNLNSDQLRQRLSNNTLNMNFLTAENDTIVKILAERGLKAVEQAAKEKSFAIDDDADLAVFAEKFTITDRDGVQVANSDWSNPAVNPEPKRKIALTTEELNAGGWWCADVSEECANAFKSKYLRVFNSSEWGDGAAWGSCHLGSNGDVTRGSVYPGGNKQIHLIGNHFYWGAPSDQS